MVTLYLCSMGPSRPSQIVFMCASRGLQLFKHSSVTQGQSFRNCSSTAPHGWQFPSPPAPPGNPPPGLQLQPRLLLQGLSTGYVSFRSHSLLLHWLLHGSMWRSALCGVCGLQRDSLLYCRPLLGFRDLLLHACFVRKISLLESFFCGQIPF